MTFSFHPEARLELMSSVDYYENIQTGLGLDFMDEILLAIERILQYPQSSVRLSQNSRRCLINKFPYGIIYQIKKDEIIIIAIAHLNRKPGFWKNREQDAHIFNS